MDGIKRLESAIQYLRREVAEEMPIQHVAIVITVANNEGITQHDLGRTLNMFSGTISRSIKVLSQYGERDKAGMMQIRGHNLLDTRPDLYDRKRQSIWLTAKGKQVVAELNKILEG